MGALASPPFNDVLVNHHFLRQPDALLLDTLLSSVMRKRINMT